MMNVNTCRTCKRVGPYSGLYKGYLCLYLCANGSDSPVEIVDSSDATEDNALFIVKDLDKFGCLLHEA